MEVRISVVGNNLADLEALDDWLRQERELAGRVKIAAAPPREGHLGAVSDALVVAVGSGGTLTVLAASLKAWISMPRHSDVRIRIHGTDGRFVEIDADRISRDHIDTLVRQALGAGIAKD